MKKIYKYELIPAYGGETKVMLPLGIEILSCGFQGDKLFIWGIVDTWQKEEKELSFIVVMTGEEMPSVVLKKYIGTFSDYSGPLPFVLHLFLKS